MFIYLITDVDMMQLPIERLIPQTMLPRDKTVCQMCEYFLHYVQTKITESMTEEKLMLLVEQGCDKLPISVRAECREFVETYGPAFIAILAQDIDPSQVNYILKTRIYLKINDVGFTTFYLLVNYTIIFSLFLNGPLELLHIIKLTVFELFNINDVNCHHFKTITNIKYYTVVRDILSPRSIYSDYLTQPISKLLMQLMIILWAFFFTSAVVKSVSPRFFIQIKNSFPFSKYKINLRGIYIQSKWCGELQFAKSQKGILAINKLFALIIFFFFILYTTTMIY